MLPNKRKAVRKWYGFGAADVAVGFHNGPSITDTEPKRGPQISPEVQAMFHNMQLNMMQREARLLAALKK